MRERIKTHSVEIVSEVSEESNLENRDLSKTKNDNRYNVFFWKGERLNNSFWEAESGY